MSIVLVFFLIAVVSATSWGQPADADDLDVAESARTGVVLESGPKDSSTVIDTGNSVSVATLDSLVEEGKNMSTGMRVAVKLVTGAYTGLMGGIIASSNCEDGQDLRCVGPALSGYLTGVAIGVSVIDLRGFDSPDPTILSVISTLGVSLGGTALGIIGAAWLTEVDPNAFPSLVIAPVVGATLASEWWRKFSSARRFSIGLAPNPRGSLSAAVTMRF